MFTFAVIYSCFYRPSIHSKYSLKGLYRYDLANYNGYETENLECVSNSSMRSVLCVHN